MTSRSLNALTKERSLFALYRLSYKFPANYFNQIAVCTVFFLLVFYAGLAWREKVDLLPALRALINVGLQFATSILGFLIAGFTVFVSVTKVDIFLKMAEMPFDDTGESWLKYNLSAFMLAFAHYVAYVFMCLVFVILASQDGLTSLIYRQLAATGNAEDFAFSRRIWTYVCFVGFATWSLYVVLLLKSFVFNIYAVITIVVGNEMTGEPPRRLRWPIGRRSFPIARFTRRPRRRP
jgi:hypothetical protein